MSHPIHHSVVGSDSRSTRNLKIVAFVILILSIATGVYAQRLDIILSCIFVLLLYEVYVVAVYPNTTFLSIRNLNSTDFKYITKYSWIFGIITVLHIGVLTLIIRYSDLELVIHSSLESVSISAPVLVASVIVPALSEEILFRHFCQGRLLKDTNRLVRVNVPATIFVFLHVPVYSMSPSGVLTVSILLPFSLAMALVYERTNNILAPIVVHAVVNLTVVILFLLLGCFVC